ncbi:MAG: hypothetical protein H7Y27_14280 [Gemmatimonadaceae bacterium]|nr:hypothetical protein [Chitinophagaceae bacterium]
MDNQSYGIDKESAHKRAIELIPEEFFWDCTDELAPFGSDEGDQALADYRSWRQAFPGSKTLDCLKWVINEVAEMEMADYNETLVS